MTLVRCDPTIRDILGALSCEVLSVADNTARLRLATGTMNKYLRMELLRQTLNMRRYYSLVLAEMLLDKARGKSHGDFVTYLEFRTLCYYLSTDGVPDLAEADTFNKEERTLETAMISAWLKMKGKLLAL